MEPLKLTEQIAADLQARIKSLDFSVIEKTLKAKDTNGSFDVIISTEDLDRAGEIVRQDGWELANYKNNPIVLWGHDYYNLPIGICTETYKTTYHGLPATGAKGIFFSDDINPLAQQVRRMYDYGVKSGSNVGCTTSVGFIPKEFDEDNQRIITRAELLEFSFVPVPANQGVGPAAGRALTFDEARELGINVSVMSQKGLFFSETLGVVPENVSEKKAEEGTKWSKPSLSDFTDKQWEDLSDTEKKYIAGHFAWAKENPAASFGDLKLPHHDAKSGAVVWSGVKAAMGALNGARGGVEVEGDKKAVYEHLAAHYRQFDQEPPELKSLKEAQPGDNCQTDDGSPGVLTTDPNDPDGPLVCLPQDEDKSAALAHISQKALLKALGDEHDRHTDEEDKAVEAFKDAADGEPEHTRAALKDLRSSLADEHTMHRAKTIAAFRSFDPSDAKAFDKKPHLKALRDEHDAYEEKCDKAVDGLEERCMKAAKDEDQTDGFEKALDTAQRGHKKAVTKIAKAMCKAAFGDEDAPDEKTLAILKEFLAPHIDPQMLNALTTKLGARISAASKEKLGEAHEHLKAATAIVEALHGGLGNDEGEESRSGDEEKSQSQPAPATQRSRPSESRGKDDLNDFLLGRDIVREIHAVTQRGLEQYNKRAKR
jgi:hypothetical protein